MESIYKAPDAIGNLFRTPERKDRKYGKGGRLLEDRKYSYHYDGEGNLVLKQRLRPDETLAPLWQEGDWVYEWLGNGMLRSVKRPDGETVSFEYDPLGRRISKRYRGTTTRWVWDGNVPLHECTEEENVTTWLFEEGSFVPCAKLQNGESYSIITDYLGTPTEMYTSNGEKTWSAELDIYGSVRNFAGRSLSDCPFRFQGMYYDTETELCYVRHRYYSCDTGAFISQDPIGLAGNNPTIYGYVFDSNTEIDPFGLDAIPNKVAGNAREAIARTWLENKFPNAEILSERYIRDINGKSVRDISGSRRRLDFVVVEDGKVKGIFEVTSPTADKTAQMLKEADIRGNGGTRVKAPGRKGALYDISDIETQRLDVDLETKNVKCH
ncbi:hypothetical protein HQ50_02045 [Porphyromonas sp. COT-052 OH4946]|uniref:RHS repeat domain-containing protein n=1 Tax=Porphyromonas sp. COT-052 OH4946 TaxID=1515618 RepID=UPI00051D1D17|nr:RHS repeat-associated core domain-containing protein [Porphyromonas sp. COT-052 OH4946]KGL56398.1 hypothetical protein HQ50_02045 [Porphyromonas sp. COT-052 OH4946]